MTFRFLKYGLVATTGFIVAGLVPPTADARTHHTRAACSVTIDTVNVAVIGSASGGGGVLHCKGKSYAFTIGGGGVGSIGVSKMQASGAVYRLARVSDFEGVYGRARAGATFGPAGAEAMTLENEHGVVMQLQARSKGLALTAGADALVVKFK